MNIRYRTLLCAAALVGLFGLSANAQDKKFELKLSHWVPPSHPLQKSLEEWGASVQKDSGGSITYKVFPSQQLGKAFDHYDMARDGIADLTYVNPGAFHSTKKKILVPGDIKGMKIRPADATIATFMTMLGATNVQAAAPEVRDVLERGVADAVTFPWGSVPLFGIDKVTKYHLDMPLYVTTFVFAFNKAKYEEMSAAQKKVIDNHCTPEWALKVAAPWADFEHAGIAKIKAETGHEVYEPSAAQVAEWKKAAEPLEKTWADNVRKAGGDPDTIMKELRAQLEKDKAAY